MSKILCATRGGPRSYPNQELATRLAKERGATLTFLYVSNVRFLDRVASPIQIDLVEAELDELGEFMLAMAQERAAAAGVRADIVVRRGIFREALKEVIHETGAELIVLGSSPEGEGFTSRDYLQMLTELLQAETALHEIIIAQEGEIIQHQVYDRSGEANEP